MTITLNPNQEEAVRAAIRTGQVGSVEELIDRALAGLPQRNEAEASTVGRTIAEQGLGLFGSPEDAALLDEVVSEAYAERRRPSQRKPTL
jgi:Arc/MetJ-type ribon-helix-helix transcriptional regulator